MLNRRKMTVARRGSVMMETVIVMPILLFLIFVIVQFAHIWTAKQMVSYAAFCATRAITVVPPGEQHAAALNAAKMALSWMCLVDRDEGSDARVTVPGWGEIPGARSVGNRVGIAVMQSGVSNNVPVAAVSVTFRFPLLISAMAVNKVLGMAASNAPTSMDDGEYGFYANLDRMAGNPGEIDGWPFVTLSETCVLPMPYSTARFPTGGFANCSLR